MTKFILFMWLCSAVAHDCKRIVVPYATFDSYRDCSIYGYEHSVTILNNMPETEIEKWQIHTRLSCKAEQTI